MPKDLHKADQRAYDDRSLFEDQWDHPHWGCFVGQGVSGGLKMWENESILSINPMKYYPPLAKSHMVYGLSIDKPNYLKAEDWCFSKDKDIV